MLFEMFALEKQVVNTLVSKMIISDELFASWDQPTGSIVMVSLSLGLGLGLGLCSWSWDQPTGSIVMAGNSQQKMYSIGVRIQERFRV